MWTFTWIGTKNHYQKSHKKVMRFSHINQCIDVSINIVGCGNLQEFADLKTSEKL